MSLRISSLGFAALALAGCSGEAPVQPQAEEGAKPIDCALGEGSDFGAYCFVENGEVEGQEVLTIRHPDGGFRRFTVNPDGSGLSVADGADAARNALIENGERLEVVVGEDRYRLPVRDHDAGAPKN
ncbi:hypothetical protein [Parerythrobacter lacustris]|uniref:Lipoprotein n=1 Tax=Parerythrobacter lacustris TaxID=2969984 RepID=A0ABT1XR20_9SPHN|nr:hypothetical protein [Parerythrobacter lacustris]MCR2833677.1 hypothetical protein [Parerythrobacter lacustris]